MGRKLERVRRDGERMKDRCTRERERERERETAIIGTQIYLPTYLDRWMDKMRKRGRGVLGMKGSRQVNEVG